MPGGGNVLCASVVVPFQLSDGSPVTPQDWFQALMTHAQELVAPDTVSPLPGAEVLVLGNLPPLMDDRREVHVRCGQVFRDIIVRRDPQAPDAPPATSPEAAAWHEQDNPVGRGGPEDERRPLIVDAERPERPIWLGPTPLDHPARLRRMGVAAEEPTAGWPDDADPAIFYESHDSFWTRSLHPGDPIKLTGVAASEVDASLPPYRVVIASSKLPDGRWEKEPARIHCVTLLPAADMGAMMWRTAIDIGDDVTGDTVSALVAALEDVDAPPRDEQDLAEIAVDRWQEPAKALDDRPLLPRNMATAVALPFGMPPGDDPISERREAAEEWMREEMDVEDVNPFSRQHDEVVADLQEAGKGEDDQPPDMNAVGNMAAAALAVSKKRREESGFPEPDEEAQEKPERRDDNLEAEVDKRLARPHSSPREVAMAANLDEHGGEMLAADETLDKLGEARVSHPKAPMFWPAMEEDEAERFGERLVDHLGEADPERHIDVSGAIVGTGPGAAAATGVADQGTTVSARRLDGLLAENTAWRGVTFENCEMVDSSFANGQFDNCEFRDCVFERVNFSHATFTNCRVFGSTFRELSVHELTIMDSHFEQCVLAKTSFSEAALRDVWFKEGSWEEVQWDMSYLIRVSLTGTAMNAVTYSLTHAPHSHFEGLSMFKVWAMTKGFPGSTFVDVEARTCGFLSACHFDECRFENTRFAETGFTGAFFKDVTFTPGCSFDTCDFTGALFDNAELTAVRFLECSMATSIWTSANNATRAWFLGSTLRGVDFTDTRLGEAVFTDADIDGAIFEEDKIIGADFRGTVRGTA